MQDGFLRAAAASIPVAVADPRRNAAACCARIDQAHRASAALLVLPELCVTGYTCGDLFLSALLLDAAEEALLNICAHTQNCDPVVVLGVPLRAGGKLYNCAAVLHRGRILGIVPKTWLPNYDVFAEKRCFTSAAAYSGPGCVPVGGQDVPFGTGLVFACAQQRAASAAMSTPTPGRTSRPRAPSFPRTTSSRKTARSSPSTRPSRPSPACS